MDYWRIEVEIEWSEDENGLVIEMDFEELAEIERELFDEAGLEGVTPSESELEDLLPGPFAEEEDEED